MLSFPWGKLRNNQWTIDNGQLTKTKLSNAPSGARSQMSDEKGLSLVEVLMVIVAIGFIVILMANLPNAMGLITKSRHSSLAREIAAKQIEDKRATSYVNLVNDTQAVTDARLTSLPQGSGTVVVEDCDIAICTNAEPLKQVTVTVNWVDKNIQQQVSLKTFLGQGGLNQ